MKKILLIILLFVSAKAFAQYPMPPGMSNVLSMSGFFKISGSDTIFVIKGANGNVYPVSSGGNFIRNGTSLQTANFNISGIGRIGDSLLVRGVTRSTGVIQSAANIARGTIIEDTLKASSNSALLIGLDINPGFNDNGHTSVRHMAVKASGSVSPGLDNAYTLGNIFVPGAVQYIWKNAYTYGVESPHNLTLKVDTGNIYLKGIPDTSAGYKAVVITADGRVQTAPYGGGGGNTIYTTDDSLRSDRIVTQNLHPLLFYSNNPTSNLSGVLDLEYNYQNMSVTDSLGNAAQVGTTTRLSNDQSQAFIAVQNGAKLKLIQMNSNPNGHSVDFKGIYFTDHIDSVGAIYTDTTSYKYGKRYNTWIPSWGAVKTRIDSAIAAHSGGLTGATNGLSVSGSNAVLGGAQTGDITISNQTHDLYMGDDVGDGAYIETNNASTGRNILQVGFSADKTVISQSNGDIKFDLYKASNSRHKGIEIINNDLSGIIVTDNSKIGLFGAQRFNVTSGFQYLQKFAVDSTAIAKADSIKGTITGYVPYSGATGNVNLGSNFITAGASLTPQAAIHAISTISTTPRGILSDQNSADAVGARITMRKSRGTPASPTVITTGDVLGSWTAAGYTNAYTDAAKVLVTSTGTISNGVVPSIMELQTMTTGGTLTDGIKIDQAQVLTFGAYGTGLLHSGSAGAITSSAVNLAGADVTGLLPDGNISSAATWNAKISPSDTTTAFANLVHINKAETILGLKRFTAGKIAVGVAPTRGGQEISLNNTDFTNSSGAGSVLIFSNPATSGGQNVLYNEINGTMRSKWRTDASGNINWVANGGNHYFFTGGDFGSGNIRLAAASSGSVYLGGAIDPTTFAGAKMTVLNAGRVLINTTTDDGSNALQVNGSVSIALGSRLKVVEGTGGFTGQTTLVSGTKAITITGVTTASRAFCQLVSQGGTVTTTQVYAAVCTANTLTITALTNAGSTDTTDTSVLNYFIVN